LHVHADLPWSNGVVTRVALNEQQYNGSVGCGLCLMFSARLYRFQLPVVERISHSVALISSSDNTSAALDAVSASHSVRAASLRHL